MSLIRDIVVFLCGLQMIDVSLAQVLSLGGCTNVSVMENLDASKYLGKWYEAQKYFAIFELGGKCVTAEYTDQGDGVIGVTNRMINTLQGNAKQSVQGTARLVNPPEGKAEVKFPQAPFPAPYWVLGTDYTSYAVVWGCKDLEFFNLSFSWILTRERNPPSSVLEKAFAVIDKNRINRNPYQVTDQSDCPSDL